MDDKRDHLPNLSRWTILALTFGCFGINMAGSLQSSQMGRIFQTIGADPTKLGYFFILPPLVGMIVQPLIGKYSDMTWTRFGRRMPYTMIAAPFAALMLILLPNSGSLGFGYGSTAAMLFGAFAILFMDLSTNASMQPLKMVISDMVNKDQENFAWSWSSNFSSIGGILATLLPAILTFVGVSNVGKKGSLPNSVIWSFYITAAILLVTTLLSVLSVHEYNPEKYAKYHGISIEENKNTPSFIKLLKKAPKSFWQLSLIEFFCWFPMQYMWTYSTGAIAKNVYHVTDPSTAAYQAAGNWYGVLFGIFSLVGIGWGLVIAKTKPEQRKLMYKLGILLGSLGYLSVFFITNKWLLIISYSLLGIMFVTMNTIPFTILSDTLGGKHQGSYLGLFNISICIPQITASICSFIIFPLVGKSMPAMFIVAAIVAFCGIFFVQRVSTEKS